MQESPEMAVPRDPLSASLGARQGYGTQAHMQAKPHICKIIKFKVSWEATKEDI